MWEVLPLPKMRCYPTQDRTMKYATIKDDGCQLNVRQEYQIRYSDTIGNNGFSGAVYWPTEFITLVRSRKVHQKKIPEQAFQFPKMHPLFFRPSLF